MGDYSEPGAQIELLQEQRFDMENGFETDGFREDDKVGDSVDHRVSSSGKLFVGGVSWETTEANFTSYFRNYGEVIDSVIILDKHSGRPRGFGFVTFADPAIADKVLEEDHVIDGKTVEVKRTVPRGHMEAKRAPRIKKIFVGGLPPSLSNDELREYFSRYGSIVDSEIMLDHQSRRSRCFGFVTFDNEDAAEQIFSGGKKHELGGKQVDVKRAEPRRVGSDYNGNAIRSYGGFSDSAAGHDGYNYGAGQSFGIYGLYNAYGNFGGSYAGFYCGYGGYLCGFGYGGAMYGGAGYGGNGYGMLGGHGVTCAYNWPGGSMAGGYHPCFQ